MMKRTALGLWGLGESRGFHERKDPRTAKNEIKDAWRLGIRTFDTAFSYGTDSLLYSALKEMGVRTDEAEIIEKVMPVPTFRKKTEACLRALGTERVSYLLLHWPAEDKMLFGALRDAEKLLDEGKAGHIGVSNFPADLVAKVSQDFPIELSERAYSPVWIRDEEKERLPMASYGIFGFGTLFHETAPADERGKLYMYENMDEFRALIGTLLKIEREHGVSRAEILYSFARGRSEITIVGSGRKEYLGSSFSLTEGERDEIRLKALALNAKARCDNIFGHSWRLN